MSINKHIQLGLCCMNTTLKNQTNPVYSSRKIILRIVYLSYYIINIL